MNLSAGDHLNIASNGDATFTANNNISIGATGGLFLNLPTVAGASGSVWNNAGIVSVAP